MDDILKQILGKLNDMEQRIDQRFDEMDQRFDQIETELEDVKRVVRLSAEDILENQVEQHTRHEINEKKIDLLAAQQTHLAKRISRLEKEKKANE